VIDLVVEAWKKDSNMNSDAGEEEIVNRSENERKIFSD